VAHKRTAAISIAVRGLPDEAIGLPTPSQAGDERCRTASTSLFPRPGLVTGGQRLPTSKYQETITGRPSARRGLWTRPPTADYLEALSGAHGQMPPTAGFFANRPLSAGRAGLTQPKPPGRVTLFPGTGPTASNAEAPGPPAGESTRGEAFWFTWVGGPSVLQKNGEAAALRRWPGFRNSPVRPSPPTLRREPLPAPAPALTRPSSYGSSRGGEALAKQAPPASRSLGGG